MAEPNKQKVMGTEDHTGCLSASSPQKIEEFAYLNLIEDLEAKRQELENSQRAFINLMEDMSEKNEELEQAHAASLNMMQDLADAKAEIEQFNQELENKVEEKTSELKESTAQLVQAEKLTALGELTAGIAHELKQPLNIIKIICQSLLRDIKKEKFQMETAREELPEIVLQVNKMSEIIDHMRIFTRRSDGQTMEIFNLNTVVKGALKFLEQQFSNHGIRIETNLSETLPELKGDAIRLEQVLMNLMNNARHALETSSKSDKLLTLGTGIDSTNKLVHIYVKDNGCGIPEYAREKILQPFYTTKDPGKGTGLGLSISRKILEEHGGSLTFETEENAGTTFWMKVPLEGEA